MMKLFVWETWEILDYLIFEGQSLWSKSTEISVPPVHYWRWEQNCWTSLTVPWKENNNRPGLLQSWCILTCYYLPPEQLSNSTRKSSQVLPSHIILSLLHQDQFLLSPLEAEPQQVSQNFMKLLTVLHRPWSYGQIHPDIPVISILHPSADLMSVGSAAGEVLECSVEPEGRTGSHRVHQVTINEEWGS